MDKIIERFSSWQRIKKFIAWMLQYRGNLSRHVNERNHKGILAQNPAPRIVPQTVEEIENAEKEIIKYVQKRSYPNELSVLQNCQPKAN